MARCKKCHHIIRDKYGYDLEDCWKYCPWCGRKLKPPKDKFGKEIYDR